MPLRGAGGMVTHFVGMQTFSPAAEEAQPDDICGSSPRAVQRQGGLTGEPHCNCAPSCMNVAFLAEFQCCLVPRTEAVVQEA